MKSSQPASLGTMMILPVGSKTGRRGVPPTVTASVSGASGPLTFSPNPAAPGATTPFGTMCMPVLPFGPTEFVFADAFGAFAPIVTAGPVPYTISIPPSVLTFSLDVTLQSVVAIPTSPGLAITNAIDLRFRPSLPPVITTVAPLSATAGATITDRGVSPGRGDRPMGAGSCGPRRLSCPNRRVADKTQAIAR